MMGKLPEDRRNIFTDAYRFYEKYWDMPDTDTAYAECAAEMAEIGNRHGNTILAKELLIAIYTAIEQENRAAREAQNSAER